MIPPIKNKHVASLVEALVAAPYPTVADIREAMAIAYAAGRADGSLESCGKWADSLDQIYGSRVRA